ncbi:NusB antitermination factor [Isobaculum melis]|uniref:Transcription antitermination protein NusB n=2 Tax=Isobaculum melis TaxID=142588 RepID=A0A1H9TVZ1_9LACT|nr:transcription antitermination factor NusB [Isobaculum melis]SES01540.1 NusB antitermination factor [Isobaculum melis]
MNRREMREKALQTLFQLETNEDLAIKDAIQTALLGEEDEVEDAIFEVPTYLEVLVSGVQANQAAIDEKIKAHLENWSMNRLAKVDLIIMRIAIFEICYIDNVPNRVALNEAIEVTKRYSDEKSRKFVNGLLAKVVDEIEA